MVFSVAFRKRMILLWWSAFWVLLATAKKPAPVIKQLAGLRVDEAAGMAGMCLNSKCGGFTSLLKNDLCLAAFECSECDLNSKTRQTIPIAKHCGVDMQPSSKTAIVLALGHFDTTEKIKGSFFKKQRDSARLSAEWMGGNDVSIEHCKIEGFNMDEAVRKLSQTKRDTGFISGWFRRVSIMVTLTKITNRLFNTQMGVTILYTPSADDVEFSKDLMRVKPCRQHESVTQINNGPSLKDGRMITIMQSISVPWDVRDLSVDNFEVRLKCEGMRSCSPTDYAICIRLQCDNMDSKESMEILTVQALLKSTPAAVENLTPEQAEELKLMQQEELQRFQGNLLGQPAAKPLQNIQPHRQLQRSQQTQRYSPRPIGMSYKPTQTHPDSFYITILLFFLVGLAVACCGMCFCIKYLMTSFGQK